MEFYQIMSELESMGTARTKKHYMSQGAKEPLFGVATGAMKSIVKQVKGNQALAEELFATGNYDAMYLAGMIADPKIMTKADFERWMESAYFYMISDFIVSVTLAETDIAKEVADSFIKGEKDLVKSAGWSCYEWLLGTRKNIEFDQEKLASMLHMVEDTIQFQSERTIIAMNRFVIAVGISYEPLHAEALDCAKKIGQLYSTDHGKEKLWPDAEQSILDAVQKGRIGFKRKNVRC